jgi:hypothetical protein
LLIGFGLEGIKALSQTTVWRFSSDNVLNSKCTHPISSRPTTDLASLPIRFAYSSSIEALCIPTISSPILSPKGPAYSPLLPKCPELFHSASSAAHASKEDVDTGVALAPERIAVVELGHPRLGRVLTCELGERGRRRLPPSILRMLRVRVVHAHREPLPASGSRKVSRMSRWVDIVISGVCLSCRRFTSSRTATSIGGPGRWWEPTVGTIPEASAHRSQSRDRRRCGESRVPRSSPRSRCTSSTASLQRPTAPAR